MLSGAEQPAVVQSHIVPREIASSVQAVMLVYAGAPQVRARSIAEAEAVEAC